jgi:poly(3-hydroxybutyrate) depolymerase
MHRTSNVLVFLAVLLVAAKLDARKTRGDAGESILAGGSTRTYLLHVPKDLLGKSAP